MKKVFLGLLLLLMTSSVIFAQNTFQKGDKVINLGIGFGSSLYSGPHYTSRTPPLSGSFEVGIMDNVFDDKSSIGVGGYLGYTGAKWQESGWGWKYSSVIAGARGSLHYQFIDKLDTYTGLMLGFNLVGSSSFGSFGTSTTTAASSGIVYSWLVGGRYYFSDKFAGLVELGYGVSFLNLGIAIKL